MLLIAIQVSILVLEITGPAFALTALKRKERSGEIITRGYNLTREELDFELKMDGLTSTPCDLLENKLESEQASNKLKPAQIISYLWEPKK